MLPTPEEAMRLLDEGNARNPGPWREHSIVVAECAEKIARACGDMDSDKAYIVGLLHDMGRRYGVTGMRHVLDGYEYLMSLGYDEPARVCLTHSFAVKDLEGVLGTRDLSEADEKRVMDMIDACEYDDYDLLIQLCDSIAMADGPVPIEVRMGDVKRRYGAYPQDKWDRNLWIQSSFERRMGRPLPEVVQ